MARTRTYTREQTTLQIPLVNGPSFSFLDSSDAVRVQLPATSKWAMSYHWHLREANPESLTFLPGGDVEFFRSLGPYRNSTVTGSSGLQWKLRPEERNYWCINTHHAQRPDSPDLEVVLVGAGNEELWRNVISSTLDADIWPELASTPAALRILWNFLGQIPLIGLTLQQTVIAWVLAYQIRMIQKKHDFWTWSGAVPFTKLWAMWPWPSLAPEWAQEAEWRSAQILAKTKCDFASLIGRRCLGLQDGYKEYFKE